MSDSRTREEEIQGKQEYHARKQENAYKDVRASSSGFPQSNLKQQEHQRNSDDDTLNF